MGVHLRRVTNSIYANCVALKVSESQLALVASAEASLAEVGCNPQLTALAVYDEQARGWEQPDQPVIGLVVYELVAGIGFILRIIIDEASQGMGYGRAAMIETIRRLRLLPEVERIATSHHVSNEPMARLCASLGFVEWDIAFAKESTNERFLILCE